MNPAAHCQRLPGPRNDLGSPVSFDYHDDGLYAFDGILCTTTFKYTK